MTDVVEAMARSLACSAGHADGAGAWDEYRADVVAMLAAASEAGFVLVPTRTNDAIRELLLDACPGLSWPREINELWAKIIAASPKVGAC